jgi:hypothetical protein
LLPLSLRFFLRYRESFAYAFAATGFQNSSFPGSFSNDMRILSRAFDLRIQQRMRNKKTIALGNRRYPAGYDDKMPRKMPNLSVNRWAKSPNAAHETRIISFFGEPKPS